MEQLGVHGNMLGWIRCFLRESMAQVFVNAVAGETIEWKYGVPQGSVLSPLLFILFQSSSFPNLGLFESHLYFTPGYRLKEQNLLFVMSTRGRCCQHLNLSITIVLSDRSEEPVDHHLGFLLIIVGTLPFI